MNITALCPFRFLLSVSLLTSGFVFTACEDEQEAPATITTAFTQRYAAATEVEWEQENKQEWEAEFEMDGITYSATYNVTGEWQETEHEIDVKEVPIAVTAAIRNHLGEVEVDEAELVESAAYGTVYELEVEGNHEKWELMIDPQGNMLKQEASENDEEDKSE